MLISPTKELGQGDKMRWYGGVSLNTERWGNPSEADIRTETRRIQEKLLGEALGGRVNSRWPEPARAKP